MIQHFAPIMFSVNVCQGEHERNKATDSKDRAPRFKTQFCHFTAAWLHFPVSYLSNGDDNNSTYTHHTLLWGLNKVAYLKSLEQSLEHSVIAIILK